MMSARCLNIMPVNNSAIADGAEQNIEVISIQLFMIEDYIWLVQG